MKLLKAKQPKPAEAPVSLAERIKQARAEAEEFIESKVSELKASPDGAILSVDWLRMNLRALNGGHCDCKVALSLLEKDSDNG